MFGFSAKTGPNLQRALHIFLIKKVQEQVSYEDLLNWLFYIPVLQKDSLNQSRKNISWSNDIVVQKGRLNKNLIFETFIHEQQEITKPHFLTLEQISILVKCWCFPWRQTSFLGLRWLEMYCNGIVVESWLFKEFIHIKCHGARRLLHSNRSSYLYTPVPKLWRLYLQFSCHWILFVRFYCVVQM